MSEGDLVFVQLSDAIDPDKPMSPGIAQVVDVFPTMVGRRPYSKSPRELAAAQNVLPVAKKVEASAADRVFGYVVPEAGAGATGGDVASRGHLSFDKVDTPAPDDNKTPPMRLAPLLSPKPSSARRFLTMSRSGETPRNDDSELARNEFFSANHSLGAAAYPVHRKLLDRKGFPREGITSTQSAGLDHSNEAVRVTARSWVEVGSVLRCTMRFTNLSREELGALIWLLTPENLVPASEKQKDPRAIGFLRMGMGKPFGLGVVETRIAKNGLRAVKNEELASDYVNLNGCLGSVTSPAEIAEFSLPNGNNLPKTPWVKALQRAAFGYSDGTEVRYMTLDENKENNKSDSKTGKPKDKRGLSPVDLAANTPTPIIIPRPNKQRRRHNSH
ncbi:hypothetical protein [Propionibacterium australiense]|uniref:hypothetical protein n=2 Tax=Propionibacterium TaxID=1743 RepID=UPI000F83BA40|nr:hypothetical protein [Propionibacterium australiense]